MSVAALFALAVLILLPAALIFNRLVGLRNRARGAWSDIDVQLKRRHDLVENLVETVRAYSRHESSTLAEVTERRSRAVAARLAADPGEAGLAETSLGGGVKHLMALAESYPDLKASERYADLHRSLVAVEDAIQDARRYYNAVVRDLNTRIQSVPDLVVARLLGFKEAVFFELEEPSEAGAPRIRLVDEP